MSADRIRSYFLDLEEALRSPDRSFGAVLPVPYERTSSYGVGSSRAPECILEASAQVEFWDEDGRWEPCRLGIATLPELLPSAQEPEEAVQELLEGFRLHLGSDRFLLSLGGEHAITPPAVRAATEQFGALTVLQIDAHADLRDSYEGSAWSHASAMRRCLEHAPVVGVGIRALSQEEAELLPELDAVHVTARECAQEERWQEKVLDHLGEQVYLTVDMDGFDPSIAPAVGTPEPGGLGWWQVTSLLERVCRERNVLAADIVECNPISGEDRTAFLAARLAYKIFGWVAASRGLTPP